MAITAQFDADFSQFNSEVGKANQQLTGLESQTTTTGVAIARMGTVTTTTTSAFTAASRSLTQFDSLLGAVGIHVGPAIKGLGELGAASGATVAELGLLGTAGLVLGTAMAAWKLGTMLHDFIQKFVDLDGAIAKAATALGLFADADKAAADANKDVLALASEHAKRVITDLTEARKINQDFVDDMKKRAQENAKALSEQAKAMETVRIAGQDWNAVLATMNPATVALAKAALDHGVNQKTVADAYRLTAPEIAAVTSALKADEDAAKASDKAHAELTAALKTHWDAVLAIRDQALGKDAVEKATQWTEAIFLLGNSVDKLSHEQLVDLQKVMTEAMTAMARNGDLTEEQALQFNDFAAAAAAAATALRPVTTEAEATTSAFEEMKPAAEEAAAAVSSLHDQIQQMQTGGTKLPGSSQTTDSMGNKYLISPTGQRVPLGPHGELPGNWFEQYTGQSSFNSAYNPLLPSGRYLPGGQTSNVVQVNSGAIQMMFPIANNPQAMDQLASVVGDALMSRITRTGTVV